MLCGFNPNVPFTADRSRICFRHLFNVFSRRTELFLVVRRNEVFGHTHFGYDLEVPGSI